MAVYAHFQGPYVRAHEMLCVQTAGVCVRLVFLTWVFV